MEAVSLYLIKMIIFSGVTFLYYRLSLKDKTFHHYNRFYLLSATVLSILLPFIKVDDFTVEVSNDLYLMMDRISNFNTTKTIDHDDIYFRIAFSVLGLVSLCFSVRLLYGILKIRQFKKTFPKESKKGISFYHTNLTEAPFSYFRSLFWKDTIVLNSEVGRQILKHEMVHIEQKHSYDKIFMETITALLWFNPFFHIIKKELSLIHEYLADKKAVKQSDTKAFAQMLLASHFSGTQWPAASPFLSSNLKKRLKMLQKPKTKFGYARRILALPVVFTVAFAYLVNAKNQEIKATNRQIEKAVAQIGKGEHITIKKDTIVPDVKNSMPTPKVYKRSDNDQRIADLSKKIQQKTENLQKLKPETDEYYKNLEELGKLSGELGRIAISPNYLKSAMVIKMNGKDININDYFKSKEWKDEVNHLKELNIEMPEMPEVKFDYPETSQQPNTSGAPEVPRVKLYTFKGTKDIRWSPDMENAIRISASKTKESAAVAKKRAKLEKERARLEEKRAKLEGERAKLEAEKRSLDGNRLSYFYSTDNVDPIVINGIGNIKNPVNKLVVTTGRNNLFNKDANTRIYIDGTEVTKKEMDALDPVIIRAVGINKKAANGKMNSEIRIETKNKNK
ncbi:M56 family metallopeptidase [uncultured Chryseobacterium sp.]|uniref:M56 family metallopeptidase n=1 Tax=uncultured Chryseobacterium sp. TaxID=259322 RepID=UPI0025E85250|nr:M56 family metallopeptidase [uncultured Chryseobacterium sp.]